MRALRCGKLLVAGFLWALAAGAIETDQYYTWDKPLRDSTDLMNAKVNLEIGRVLDGINASPKVEKMECSNVRRKIVGHFRLFLIHRLELWAINSELMSRSPQSAEEELQYRQTYLYHQRNNLDPARLMAPSPTIMIGDVRIGTDKLTHFFSEGWLYYRHYAKSRKKGASYEEAVEKAIGLGAFSERTILGMAASGVFSAADLEANHQGLLWMIELCDVEEPLLARSPEGWALREPFDFRPYINPDWDESWAASVIGKHRWKRVRPVLETYCPLLDSPEVRAERARYAERDRLTVTERKLQQLVAKGKIADPENFSIEHVCSEAKTRGQEAAAAD